MLLPRVSGNKTQRAAQRIWKSFDRTHHPSGQLSSSLLPLLSHISTFVLIVKLGRSGEPCVLPRVLLSEERLDVRGPWFRVQTESLSQLRRGANPVGYHDPGANSRGHTVANDDDGAADAAAFENVEDGEGRDRLAVRHHHCSWAEDDCGRRGEQAQGGARQDA